LPKGAFALNLPSQEYITLPEKDPVADTLIVDGSGMVNAMLARKCKIFDDYSGSDTNRKIEY